MWRTSDGVVHTRAIPSDSELLVGLISYLEQLPDERLDLLEDELTEVIWALADELDLLPLDEEAESAFAGRELPAEIIAALPWDRVLGSELAVELGQVSFRWRLDVVELVLQAIADLHAGPGLRPGRP